MHIRTAQFFSADFFTGGGFDQGRAAEEDGALLAHDHRFIAHGRHIRAARSARAHHAGDLRDALRR